ncbi:MAG: tetratricopeptide repeat protein [Candidatus Altiarchaeales archaeon]|nr:tetratricopeptide repeat protein [Candidatus Altiarchaeales archaeon]MBD3416002.1 tetratricopeptide repeat protein [Candidatus Altiarchaeales archaeon]
MDGGQDFLMKRLISMARLTADPSTLIRTIYEEEQRNPDNHMVYVLKGWAQSGMGKNTAALESFDRAIELNPRSAWGYYGKGEALRELRRFDEALKCFSRAVELKPRRADFWLSKGFMEEEVGMLKAAGESFKKAISLGDRSGWAQYGQSRLLVYEERLEEALDECRNAMQLSPDEEEFKMHEAFILDLIKD